MNIGNHALTNNVFLAPMAGVTDLPFRKICRQLGAGMVVGEMTASDISLRNTAKSLFRRVHLDEPEPRCIQIVGWQPKIMAEAALYNVDQGASVIDINMGCPAKKVCKKLAGSALLSDETQVAKILEAVVAAVNVPVTLKIRTGVDPEHRNGVSIARIAEQSGIQLLSVHGRTRACKFVGEVEYETIKKIKQAVAIPVIVNGDLDTYVKTKNVLDYTATDGAMVGRAANGAPWFPGLLASFLKTGKIPEIPSVQTQWSIVLNHLEQIYSFYGNYRGVRIARKHIKWYLEKLPHDRSCSNNIEMRKQINCEETPEIQLGLVSDYYLKQIDYLQAA